MTDAIKKLVTENPAASLLSAVVAIVTGYCAFAEVEFQFKSTPIERSVEMYEGDVPLSDPWVPAP